MKKLNDDEIKFITTAIDNEREFLYLDRARIGELYSHDMINKETYENAIKTLDDRIKEKSNMKDLISKYLRETDTKTKKNILLEKEEPKKVKSKSESKTVLKRLIDEFSTQMSMRDIALFMKLTILPSMFLLEEGPSNPIAAAAMALVGIDAAGVVVSNLPIYAASKLSEYEDSDKKR